MQEPYELSTKITKTQLMKADEISVSFTDLGNLKPIVFEQIANGVMDIHTVKFIDYEEIVIPKSEKEVVIKTYIIPLNDDEKRKLVRTDKVDVNTAVDYVNTSVELANICKSKRRENRMVRMLDGDTIKDMNVFFTPKGYNEWHKAEYEKVMAKYRKDGLLKARNTRAPVRKHKSTRKQQFAGLKNAYKRMI